MSAQLTFIALLIELMIGYPQSLARAVGHPVTWMGRLIERLVQETPVAAEILFIALDGDTRWLRKKLKKVPGSRVK